MMKTVLGLTMIFAALVLGACGSSAPANFYLLQTRPATPFLGPSTDAAGQVSIGIGPLGLPEYLDRPQMVTRSGVNSVKIHEFERWAEPLEEGVLRVVTGNLADLLSQEQIAVQPWRSPLTVDYRLGLNLTRFEGSTDGSITLAGMWILYDREKREIAMQKPFLLTRTVAGQGIVALVDGQSQLLAELCQEIARSVIAGLP